MLRTAGLRMVRGAPHHAAAPEAQAQGRVAVIPYDAAAKLRITGRPGNLLQDVISISADGPFIATAIGYGFEQERDDPIVPASEIPARVQQSATHVVGDLTLGDIPLGPLIEGFRLDPRTAHLVLESAATGQGGNFTVEALPTERVFSNLLQRIRQPDEISFLFSLVDTSTGREFQDQAAHNLASLGKTNGERPFRVLAQPFHFAPRSTLRVQVTERTEGVRGALFIVLYGYRLLGTLTCPEPMVRQLRGPPICPVETIGNPDARIIPFDYVAQFDLTGIPRNLVEVELPVNADGGFIATTIGYGVATDDRSVAMQLSHIADVEARSATRPLQAYLQANCAPGKVVDLARLPLRLFPASALLDGVRVRPGWLRVALQDNGQLASSLPFEMLDRVFERLNRPEDVAFRYAITESGTGRELQNQRLYNVAGLGIADGDRPFKRLARPMVFLPRSSIRVEIEEVFGRGEVFIVFQGYKLLEPQRVSA